MVGAQEDRGLLPTTAPGGPQGLLQGPRVAVPRAGTPARVTTGIEWTLSAEDREQEGRGVRVLDHPSPSPTWPAGTSCSGNRTCCRCSPTTRAFIPAMPAPARLWGHHGHGAQPQLCRAQVQTQGTGALCVRDRRALSPALRGCLLGCTPRGTLGASQAPLSTSLSGDIGKGAQDVRHWPCPPSHPSGGRVLVASAVRAGNGPLTLAGPPTSAPHKASVTASAVGSFTSPKRPCQPQKVKGGFPHTRARVPHKRPQDTPMCPLPGQLG